MDITLTVWTEGKRCKIEEGKLSLLIIVLRLDPVQNLLFSNLTPNSSLINSSLHPSLDPFARCNARHKLRILISLVPQPLKYGTLHRPQLQTILRPHEIQDSKPINTGLIRWRSDDAMDAAL